MVAEVYYTRGKDLQQPWGQRFVRERQALYVDRDKLILSSDGADELYDLEADLGERNNLADQPPHAETERELRRRLRAFFDQYAEPKYDLWRGGKSKHEPDFPFPKRGE